MYKEKNDNLQPSDFEKELKRVADLEREKQELIRKDQINKYNRQGETKFQEYRKKRNKINKQKRKQK